MKIISFFSKNTPYETVINEHLIPSIKKFDLDHEIIGIEDKGSWQLNVSYKPYFIKNMLLKHKESVCFIDSDGEIVQHPSLLFTVPKDAIFSYHPLHWHGHWKNDWKNTSYFELLTGTMLWNYTPESLEFLDKWIAHVEKDKNNWGQKALETMIETMQPLNLHFLPAEYCCVLMHDNSIPKYITDPVIIHHQASRKYKNRSLWNT